MSAGTTDKVSNVIDMMKEKGISQLPVSDGQGYIKGLVTETSILKALYEGDCQPGDPIESLVDTSVEFISQEDGIEKISSLIAENKTPLVMDSDTGVPIAVLTRIDLLSYLSQRR